MNMSPRIRRIAKLILLEMHKTALSEERNMVEDFAKRHNIDLVTPVKDDIKDPNRRV